MNITVIVHISRQVVAELAAVADQVWDLEITLEGTGPEPSVGSLQADGFFCKSPAGLHRPCPERS